jgi:peptide/nickel transport system substrate-binding protein
MRKIPISERRIRMKRLILAVVLTLAAASLAFAQQAAKKGPIVDKVYFDVKMNEEICLKDVSEGKADIFMYDEQGNVVKALPAEVRAKMDAYIVPSGTWSMLMNPYPNKAPYTAAVGGKTYFNPFAIREVRFAMNFLISRRYLVDEILGGDGEPMFTMGTPGQPGTYKYNLIGSKFGFTATGNEKKAIQDITNAMARASELPELRGKLEKKGDWWSFDGEPVTMKFLIRSDDPNGRLLSGRYLADQVEKAGLKVERAEMNRAACFKIYADGNPADYQWNLYTEAWSAGATRAWWDNIVSQMYAPWSGSMPGGMTENFWNYENAELDELSQKAQNGQYVTEKEYWDMALKATELGLQDSVRFYVASQQSYYMTNKARFNTRMAYGLGDGLNEWSIKTADVKPEKNGEKVLRVTQFSDSGSLFMSSWDPVGVDGFGDTYSLNIVGACSDSMVSFEAPHSALDTPWRASWKDVQTKIEPGKDKDGNAIVVGKIPVPADAIRYDSATKTWKKVGPGVTSFSKGTYTYKWGRWHNSRPITVADIMYAQAFIFEWMNKDGDADKAYDSSYEANMRPSYEIFKGYTLNPDGTITTYFDFNHASKDRIGSTGGIWVRAYGNSYNLCVSWDITEALAKLVTEGGKSGTNWSFSSDPAFTEVDVINPKCLADLRAKLEEMKAAKYVPASIAQWKTPATAVADYAASIAFIDKYKNAFISNGPFSIGNVDQSGAFIELRANRDPSYPFTPDYFPKLFTSKTTRLDSVNIPSMAARSKEAVVTAKVSVVDYPVGTAKAADASATVTLTLVTADGEKVYKGAYLSAGQFSATIPAADMKGLKAGSYTIVVQSVLKGEAPAVEPATLVVF